MKQKKFILLSVMLATLSVFVFSGVMANTDVNLADLSPPTSQINDVAVAKVSCAVVTKLVNDATAVSSMNTWATVGTPMKMKSAAGKINAETAKEVLVYSQTEVRRSAPFSDVTKVAGQDETSLNSNGTTYTTNSGAQDRASPNINNCNVLITRLANQNASMTATAHTMIADAVTAYLKTEKLTMQTDKVPIAEFQQINIGMNSSNVASFLENSRLAEDSGVWQVNAGFNVTQHQFVEAYSEGRSPTIRSKNGLNELYAFGGIYFSHPPTIDFLNGGCLHGGSSSPLIAVTGQHDYPNPFNFNFNA
ncbi:hypothetical protein IID19_00525 [Patescibacteria group bacterium]|nr:hypothetical protein [Patescibacteria group bacterium]